MLVTHLIEWNVCKICNHAMQVIEVEVLDWETNFAELRRVD